MAGVSLLPDRLLDPLILFPLWLPLFSLRFAGPRLLFPLVLLFPRFLRSGPEVRVTIGTGNCLAWSWGNIAVYSGLVAVRFGFILGLILELVRFPGGSGGVPRPVRRDSARTAR